MTLLQLCFRFYNSAANVLTPGLRSTQYDYLDLVREVVPGNSWLDIGCGHQVVPNWMRNAADTSRQLVQSARWAGGVDISHDALVQHQHFRNRVVSDGYHLPFADNSFDIITANMVIEHVGQPADFLKEVRRVLRSDGRLAFHTTNYWNYLMLVASAMPGALRKRLTSLLEGRAESDIFPTFYRLNTPAAIRDAASRNGYELETIKILNSSAVTVRLGPLVLLELLTIRLLSANWAENFRSNIIVVLRKTDEKLA